MPRIRIDPGWPPASAGPDVTIWEHAGTGDRILVQDFDLVPNLPAGLDDLGTLRRLVTEQEAANAATVIELDRVSVAGSPALTRLVKLPRDASDPRSTGQIFMAFVVVPKADSSTMAALMAPESQPTGMREAMVAQRLIGEGMSPSEWALPHPYAPHVQTRLPTHRGDDPRWDAEFPDHPLTRARQWLRWVVDSATLDPEFAARAPFTAP